ncbi:MAG: beta-N-acetylhexosaminidase [Deltaproteobacteria bacterium]|nr:beta-N-acetylhexosaminidase [Deltaproteobacteria bacterium]
MFLKINIPTRFSPAAVATSLLLTTMAAFLAGILFVGPGSTQAQEAPKEDAGAAKSEEETTVVPQEKTAEQLEQVESLLASMTTEQKVGQLLFLGFGGKVMDETIARFLKQKQPGGVALFGRNIKKLKQTLTLIHEVRRYDPHGIPLFVSVDQEGGNVVRIRQGATIIPSNMALGASFDEDLSRRAGQSLGWDLAVMGFNMNLAPVLDVNSNPKNPVIGSRSFGADPVLVAKLGVAYVKGMQGEGVSAVAKHFPGHGDTASDSHFDMPSLPHDEERLSKLELPPFQAVFDAGLDGLMTAHIALPAITEEPDMPATVSKNVLTTLLREKMGYKSIVITDGLEMAGIVKRYGSGEAAVRAVVAGADMVMVLWFPEKKNEVERMLRKAVKSGRISMERLDDAVRHILAVKVRRGLFTRKKKDVKAAMWELSKSPYRKVVDEIARRAITVVKNEGDTLPLVFKANKDATKKRDKIVAVSSERSFLKSLAYRNHRRVRQVRMSLRQSKAKALRTAKSVARKARNATAVVVTVREPSQAEVVRQLRPLLEKETKLVVVTFGVPYVLSDLDVDAALCAFGFRGPSTWAASQILKGEIVPKGRLPIALSEYAVGHGLRLDGSHLPHPRLLSSSSSAEKSTQPQANP